MKKEPYKDIERKSTSKECKEHGEVFYWYETSEGPKCGLEVNGIISSCACGIEVESCSN